jgi:hypothetical protein
MSVLLSLLVLPTRVWSQYGEATKENRPTQTPSPPQHLVALMTAEGALSSVDPSGKTISIKTSSGSEQHFRYTDQTQVQGAEGTVEGLANQGGKSLRISFHSSNGTNIAVKIEVL